MASRSAFASAPAAPGWAARNIMLPGWFGWSDVKKIRILRELVDEESRDPELRRFVIQNVIAGVRDRDYRGQAAAILAWVQRNVRYVNESDEQLQTPAYTLRHRFGDCDDMAILIAAMARSIALPYRFALAGRDARGRPVRWVEGERPNFRSRFFHIYVQLGVSGPFIPGKMQNWLSAEPTAGVLPLGYDVVLHGLPPSLQELQPRAMAGFSDARAATQIAATSTTSLLPRIESEFSALYPSTWPWSEIISGTIVATLQSALTALLVSRLFGGRK